MEAIIFIGVQAAGKSTFYKEHFFDSHLRISLDVLNTRNKEQQILSKCLEFHQKVVIDNTNPTIAERKKYITQLKEHKYRLIGYYFQSIAADALERNNRREGKKRIPDVGLLGTYKRLEQPSFEEGYDELYYVSIEGDGFVVKDWKKEDA